MTGTATSPVSVGPGARVALVVNPAARRGHDRSAIEAIGHALGSRFSVDPIVPPSADEVEAAVRVSARSHDAVVVAGGDGTVHRAVCGLDGSATPLGVVPMGTGNDFARGCGIPLSPDAAVRAILDGRTRKLDLVRVNGRIYCTVGLIGAGSDAALTVQRLTKPGSPGRRLVRLFGDSLYRLVGTAHLLRPGRLDERVSLTGENGAALEPAQSVFAVFAVNTRVLGGGLELPIDADPSDGLIELALVPRMSRASLLWAFICFTRGRPVPQGTLVVHRVREAVIDCAEPVPFCADGDLMCRGTRFKVEALAQALTLIC